MTSLKRKAASEAADEGSPLPRLDFNFNQRTQMMPASASTHSNGANSVMQVPVPLPVQVMAMSTWPWMGTVAPTVHHQQLSRQGAVRGVRNPFLPLIPTPMMNSINFPPTMGLDPTALAMGLPPGIMPEIPISGQTRSGNRTINGSGNRTINTSGNRTSAPRIPGAHDVVQCSPTPHGKLAYSEKAWNTMFERLSQYKGKHNNCLVPRHYREDPKLGNWVNYQRYNSTKGCLSEERIDKLDSIGFAWNANETWDAMFVRLLQYRENHGDCLVRQECKGDPKLGLWVMTQRRKKEGLLQERVDRLNSIGFVWSVHQALWDTMFDSLVDYKSRNGHCRVPWSFKADPPLGRWVYEQRKNKDHLTSERIAQLEAIGFE